MVVKPLEMIFFLFTFPLIATYLNKKVFKLPSSIGLTVVGVLILVTFNLITSFNIEIINEHKKLVENMLFGFDFKTFLLEGIIGYLLFASAIKFEIGNLKKWWWQISILATFGVIVSAFFIGGILYLLLMLFTVDMPFLYCLLFGAIISPTDPPAAISVFKEMKSSGGAPKHIEIKLLGESLFNDGTGIVLFTAVFALILGQEFNPMEFSFDLVKEIVGAIAVGIATGFIYKFFVKQIEDFTPIAFFTLSLATGSFLLSTYLHVSAPIGVVVAGLMFGHNLNKKFSEHQLEHLHLLWDFIDEILNAALFALMAIVVLFISFDIENILLGILTFLVVLVGRYLSLYVSFFIPNLKGKVLNGSIAILSYGGIRGGISLALALSVIQTPFGNNIIAITFITVLLSNLVQGMSLKYLIQAFYPNETSQSYTGIQKHIQNFFNFFNFSKQTIKVQKTEIEVEVNEIVEDPNMKVTESAFQLTEEQIAEHDKQDTVI